MTKIFTKVKPGDLITSDLFNQITDKIEETDEITSVMEVKKNSEADASKMGNLIIKSNLGVGTKDLPSEKLEVNGTVKTGNDGQFLLLEGLKGSESTMSLDFMTSNEGRGSSSIPTASFRAIDDKYFSSHLGFLTNEASQDQNKLTERLRITSKGNVGIGTTEPSEKLEVKGTVKADKFAGDGSGLTGITGGKAGQWTDIAGGISYNAGNIGIGTEKPSAKLEVNGNIKASSIESKSAVHSFNVEGDFDQFYPIFFKDVNWGDGPMVLEINRQDTPDSEMVGSLTSKFIVHSTNGKLGADICYAEIYYNQEIKKEFIAGYENVPKSADFVVWLRGGIEKYSYRSNHFTTLDSSANTKLLNGKPYEPKKDVESYVVKNGIHFDKGLVIDGNVGIATTNPSEKLEVKGTVKADKFLGDGSGLTGLKEGQWDNIAGGISYDKGNISIGTMNIGSSMFRIEKSDGSPNMGYVRFGDGSGWKLHFGRSISGENTVAGTNGVLMTVQDNGNVGIGTMNPEAKLEVSGDIKGQANLVVNGNVGIGTTSPSEKLEVSGTVKADKFLGDGSGLTGIKTGQWTDVTGGVSYNSGNVGIGTLSPSEKLEVKGTVKADKFLGDGSGLTGIKTSQWNDVAGGIFYNAGKVGIGTTDPKSGLDVKTSGIRLRVGENNSESQLIIETGLKRPIPEIKQVTIYEKENYQGKSQELGLGGYNTLDALGNDTLSSLKVPVGMKVTLYDNTNFGGELRVITEDIPYLSDFNFNDRASSMKVEVIDIKDTNSVSIKALDLEDNMIGLDLGVSRVIISGSLFAKNKYFLINHPLYQDYNLIHSSLEGPEVAVFYRGEAQLSDGEKTILLPDYFEALTRKENRTVLLTPKFEEEIEISMLAASEVKDGKFIVKTIDNKNPSQKFYWEVKAIRADVDLLEVEQVKTPFNSSA